MNELLFFISIILCFGLLLAINRLFGKGGLYAWIAMASILANVEVTKNIALFGFKDFVTLGNVSFASIFLATDILSENYGYEESKKGVHIGLFAVISFLLMMQLDLLFIPSESGLFMDETMKNLFGLNGAFVWVTVSSVLMFYLANLLDVWLFNKIKQRTGEKKLWLRNNVASIVAQSLENFAFCILGFYLLPLLFAGNSIYSFTNCLIIAITTCLIEIIISLIDTFFVYLAKKKSNKEI